MFRSLRRMAVAAILIAPFAGAARSSADTITYNGADFSGRSSSVTFTAAGTTLNVELSNGAGSAATDPTFVLSAVFFDITGGTTSLTKQSASLASGSTVVDLQGGAVNPSPDVGAEWAYKQSLSSPAPRPYGISSAGFGIFGGSDVFPNTTGNLAGPASPDGIQYGILPSNVTLLNATSLTTNNATKFVKGAVDFSFTVPSGFSASSIKSVLFQYGTSTADSNLVGAPTIVGSVGIPTPLPSSGFAGFSLLGILGLTTVIRRRAVAAPVL